MEKLGLLKSLLRFILGRNSNGVANGLRNNHGNNHLRNGNGINGNGFIGNGFRYPPSEQPFVSIQLPMYNETRVVDRLLEACTRLDYENYEILVADDSTDETLVHLEKWAKHPKVRISHRINRTGFKGAALKHAVEVMDPRTEFVVVLDADFIPPPNILHQFLVYFFGTNGTNGNNHESRNGKPLELLDESLAVVQGYQWHVLNASENWITRGIRTEFSGSYVVERPGQELTGGMKMISGSVFMIRADLLRDIGWGTSITEDWELTIRLYLEGYRVLYSPFIQAPAECVSNFKQLARQRMRWSEGHTFNVKKYFSAVLRSPKLTRREKFEFLYYVPYYLQSVFFIIGTASWFISEIILRSKLPFWTETLGWSLVFANTFALILMNTTGLFLERGIRRNIAGLLSFVLLTFLLVPYQAYAAVKGLLEPHEGGWHRTDKTGVITDVIDRIGLGKRMRRLAPKKKKKRGLDLGKRLGAPAAKLSKYLPAPLKRFTQRHSLAFRVMSSLIIGILLLAILASQVPVGSAAPDVFYLRDTTNNGASPAGEDMNNSQGSSEDTLVFNSTDDEAYWYTEDTYPSGGDDATLAAGAYTLNMYFNQLPGDATIEVDDVSTNTTIGGSSVTISHTASGTNRLMLVGVSINPNSNEYVTGITWNTSETFTKVRSDVNSDDARTEIWYLTNPTATTANVVVSFNAALEESAIAGVVTFTGVDQTTSLGDDNGAQWTDQQNPSISVNTSVGDMVFGVVCVEDRSITATDADTEHWRTNLLNGNTTGGGGTKAGAASSTSIGWTFSGSDHTAISAVAINPAPASVDIVVSVYHTKGDGTDPQEIVTSSTKTIDANTSDPYALDIGNGVEQTFTSADPRRLRVHIDVTAVTGSGSFTLAYDSSANPSNLETPALTIPDVTMLLLVVVYLIPIVTGLITRKRRMAFRLLSVIFSFVLVLAVLATQVTPVSAEVEGTTNTFYFYDDITPQQYMMYQTQPSGSRTQTIASVTFYSDTFYAGWQVSSGTSTVYFAAASGFSSCNIPLTVKAGSTTLGTGTLSIPTQASAYYSTSFSTSAHTFSAGERLSLEADLSSCFGVVLSWDGATNNSRLVTPTLIVPEWGLLFMLMVPLLPALAAVLWRRKRLAGQVMSVLLALAVMLGVVAGDVDEVSAAPDTFYFHDTNTSGITPAGKYMNTTEGSAGSTMTFNTSGQDAYWYVDATWPTGNDDATIAAGSYTLNMYFNQLPSKSPPQVDAISSADTRPSSLTISHTTGTGSDRLMLVGISFNNDQYETVSSVTYNGANLSFVGSANESDDARVEIWSLVAPPTGTYDVVITFSTPLRRAALAGVMTFAGVNQTTPLGSFAGANGTSLVANVFVPSGTSQLVFDTVACETCSSLTVGPGQTQRWNLSEISGGGPNFGGGSTEPGAIAVAMSWALGSNDHWAIGGVSIRPSGGSAPVVDATSNGTTQRTGMTISHATSGSQRLMLVGISINNDDFETVSSVTYNGVNLSLVGSVAQSDDSRVEIWSLVAPDTGTHNVVITFSTNLHQAAKAGVMTFTGVDQTTPLGTFASANDNSAGPATVNVTSATNELVFDTVSCENCSSLTVGAAQTQRWNLPEPDGSPTLLAAGSTEPGAATVTMSWTLGAANSWAIGAAPIKPADPEVDIIVSVHHTRSDGTDATEIVTSSTKTITSSTADPYALDIGSGSQQTFTSSDPRRLRVRIYVNAIRGGGDFVLDYDGTCATSKCSNLDTPVVVVPEAAVVLVPVVIGIPMLISMLKRRKRKGNNS